MSADSDFIELSTTHGKVLGKQCTTIYNDTYYSFEGIPYAKPPLGELRFKPPEPIEAWQEPVNCCVTGQKPLQKNMLTSQVDGTEDCLYLNVFTKHLKSKKLLPVMLFLFSGGFEKGDPTVVVNSPDYFMMRDVVIVTVSYRVGPLGFLSLSDPKLGVPGNAGLKDQLLALQWFAKNAQNFNGDPNNITVFGESAGAASTHYLMLNPQAKGLFHKAILMSGNVLCSWALSPLTDLPQRLAKALDFENANNDASVLECLQQVEASKLVEPYVLSTKENMDDCLFQFGPVVEPYETPLCVIPRPPAEMLATAWGNSIPVLMGGTSFEGLMVYARIKQAPFLLLNLADEPQHALPLGLKRKYEEARAKELGTKLLRTHFGDRAVTLDNLLSYCEFASYKVFWHPIMRMAKSRLTHSKASTYLYRFDFDSPTFNHQRIKYCGDEARGAAHVDDHSYLWYGTFSWKLEEDTAEFKTIKRMIDIWTSFALIGRPNCATLDEQLGNAYKWQPICDINQLDCLNISEKLSVITLPEQEKLTVWESIYDEDECI